MLQLSSGDITIVQRINLPEDQYRDVLIRSVYMSYDSKDLSLPEVIKKLVTYAERRGLELLGCDTNSHHIGWGSTNINSKGKNLYDFIMSTGLIILNRGTEPSGLQKTRDNRYYYMLEKVDESGGRLESF